VGLDAGGREVLDPHGRTADGADHVFEWIEARHDRDPPVVAVGLTRGTAGQRGG
jgi:hypothetical protein